MNAKRLVPVSGVAAVVLMTGSFAVAGSTPAGDASVDRVVSFYAEHGSAQTESGILLSLGALFFLVFAAALVDAFRRSGGSVGTAALCLVGAGLLAAGLAAFAGLSITLADLSGHVAGSVLQTLNAFAQEAVFVFLVTLGTSAFMLGAGTASLTGGLLPKWLGWLAIVFAVVAAIPSHVLGGTLDHIGFFGFVGLGVWTVIVGILLTARSPA